MNNLLDCYWAIQPNYLSLLCFVPLPAPSLLDSLWGLLEWVSFFYSKRNRENSWWIIRLCELRQEDFDWSKYFFCNPCMLTFILNRPLFAWAMSEFATQVSQHLLGRALSVLLWTKIWNSLSSDFRPTDNINSFKHKIKSNFLQNVQRDWKTVCMCCTKTTLRLSHSWFGLTKLCFCQKHIKISYLLSFAITYKGTIMEIKSTRPFNAIPANIIRGVFTCIYQSYYVYCVLKDKSGVYKICVKKQPYQLLNTNWDFFPSFGISTGCNFA